MSKSINILILSAGRRVELIQRFMRAKERLGVNGKLIAADASWTAPALYFADEKVLIPRVSDPLYGASLKKVIDDFKIDLVVPTIDTELLKLAEIRDDLESNGRTKVLISSKSVIEICRDKKATSKYLLTHGFRTPRLFEVTEVTNAHLPLFIKPSSGSSSIDAFKVTNLKQLSYLNDYIHEPLIQEFIEGDEYTFDVFLDFDHNIVSLVARLRMAVRSGEILKGKIVSEPEVERVVEELMSTMKPIGHITVQLIKSSQGIFFIEINPRFGGGAPMSIDAGADSCEYLYRLMQGEILSRNTVIDFGKIFLRFDQSICINEQGERLD